MIRVIEVELPGSHPYELLRDGRSGAATTDDGDREARDDLLDVLAKRTNLAVVFRTKG